MTAFSLTEDRVVILGAGRGVRGGVPSAIVDIDENGRVMDWLLDAFSVLGDPTIHFVGGFKADEVVERYPEVRVIFNRDWAHGGPMQSLGLAPLGAGCDTYVCYSDVVFRRDAVERLSAAQGDVVVAVDTRWRERYEGRSRRDLDTAERVRLDRGRVVDAGSGVEVDGPDVAELAGLLRLAPRAGDAVASAIRSGELAPTESMPSLLAYLRGAGFKVTAVDLAGQWAELDARQDLARFVLGTKAESLERLRSMSHGGEIAELVSFTWRDWLEDREGAVRTVLSTIGSDQLIVRSSALAEDGWHESAAGQFESILDVDRTPAAIAAAVDEVFASYGSDDMANQVLVQEMLRDVSMSGVVMTRTHTLGAPYYVINFDDSTSRTDTVTGGGESRTVFLHRGSPVGRDLPPQLSEVLATVQSIEKLVGHDSLDIEFAVTADGRVHILQVRPIAVSHAPGPIDDGKVAAALVATQRFLALRSSPTPSLVGRRTRLSVMADWNPAEIVGTKPKRLAMSLYRHIITDEIWARQRAEYGYRDVRPCPLLVEVVGHPYVDVRATFNSFIPAELSDDLAAKLVDENLDHLADNPHLHDKVEFDVLFTCLAVDFDDKVERLRSKGFGEDEIRALRDALRKVTVEGMDRLQGDLAQLEKLERGIAAIHAAELAPLDRAYLLLEEARRVGTPAFSHLARGAFVATSLLRSLVDTGALSMEDADSFLATVSTVLGRMQADGALVVAGELDWEEFVDAYGHLRPGTYDITSPTYRASAESYLRPVVDQAAGRSDGPRTHHWDDATRAAVTGALSAAGLPDDVDAFCNFVRRAIAGREEGKFVFTKALSGAIECIAEFAAEQGLTREEIAHVRITDVLACRDVLTEPSAFLASRVLEGEEAFYVAQGVCLPGQIAHESDVVCFEQEEAEPNFVSQHVVEAPLVPVASEPGTEVDGKIAVIPNADPGYDWLLARPIAGLITMYGGANSHMAVRASELSLPAAIGVGELLYGEVEAASVLRLDCASRTITVVS
jgi:choline kinase